MMRLPISPAFEQDNLAIILEASEFFAPYASVTMLSIIEHTSPKYNYDFLVMTWDMREETAEKLTSMMDGKENISIRVVDVSEEIKPYIKMAAGQSNLERFGATGLIRLVLLDFLQQYDVVLNFDCDMLICGDVSELFQFDISNYYIGAVPDLICYAAHQRIGETQFTDDLIFKQLGLNAISEYLNAGTLLLNLKKIREDFTSEQIIEFARSGGEFFECFEQDTFNGLFVGQKLELPMEWNWQIDSAKLISNARKSLPAKDELLIRYYKSEKNAKCYHYVTKHKPWDIGVSHGGEWWAVALRTPFMDKILGNSSRIDETKGKAAVRTSTKNNKYLLFVCDSYYQIINIINIKYHFFANTPADLILCSSTDLITRKAELERLNIFRHIIISGYNSSFEFKTICELPIEEKTLHPDKYKFAVPLFERYTDMFIPVYNYHYYQMIFYQLINSGVSPTVHIFEDGGDSYVNRFDVSEGGSINHQLYPENQRFPNRTSDIFLYRPDLYCGNADGKRMIPIPALTEGNVIELLYNLFGKASVPQEKYIFFNECFSADGRISNEIVILDAIADIVGKDNISIKLHPREKGMEKIYQFHGYHIFTDNVPWEFASLSSELENKVLLAISSNTIWTPLTIMGKAVTAISLLNVMKLSTRPHAKIYTYQTFIEKVQAAANKEKTTFFRPNTLHELKQVIQYIEGES